MCCSLQNGAVINLSSLSAIQVNPDSFAYNIAKAAMDHLTKTQARKYTKLGVRVNSVNPGYVRAPASLSSCMTLQTPFETPHTAHCTKDHQCSISHRCLRQFRSVLGLHAWKDLPFC